jgi:hypothetical protein
VSRSAPSIDRISLTGFSVRVFLSRFFSAGHGALLLRRAGIAQAELRRRFLQERLGRAGRADANEIAEKKENGQRAMCSAMRRILSFATRSRIGVFIYRDK